MIYDRNRKHTVIEDALKYFVVLMVCVVCALYLTNWWEGYTARIESQREQHIHSVVGTPYIHMGDFVPVTVVKQNDIIRVHNKYIRTDRCSVMVANLLINQSNNDVHHWSAFVNWFAPGTFEANELFHVPDWIPPGDYRIVKRTAANCSGREVFFINFDLPITIRSQS